MGIVKNSLQVRVGKFNKHSMIDRNHWTTQMALKPEVFQEADRMLFASRTAGGYNVSNGKNIFESLFGGAKTVMIDDLQWSWKLNIKTYQPLTILELRTASEKPGYYREKFQVLVDEDLGAIGETWSPGVTDRSQVANIVDKVKEGRGYLYTMQCISDSVENYIDPKHLQPGTKWTRMYSLRGEAAESGGWLESGSTVEFKNSLVKLRKEYKVTDFGAQANVVEIAFMDESGKVYRSWMDYQEAVYQAAMDSELMNYALYGRLSDTPLYDPDSGYPITPGAGLLQQIESGGNVERYNQLSVELIEAFFDRIIYSRVNPGEVGEIVGMTGYYGMQEFHKSLARFTSNSSITLDSSQFLRNDPKGFHPNSLQVGYRYTSLILPNGGTFRLIHNPLYDDRSINREIDPMTGMPLESQRITILDVTGGNGESLVSDNIKLVRKNKVQARTIIEGRYGPGGMPSSNAKHSGDYYEVHISDSIGVQVTDPTITGELIKAVY